MEDKIKELQETAKIQKQIVREMLGNIDPKVANKILDSLDSMEVGTDKEKQKASDSFSKIMTKLKADKSLTKGSYKTSTILDKLSARAYTSESKAIMDRLELSSGLNDSQSYYTALDTAIKGLRQSRKELHSLTIARRTNEKLEAEDKERFSSLDRDDEELSEPKTQDKETEKVDEERELDANKHGKKMYDKPTMESESTAKLIASIQKQFPSSMQFPTDPKKVGEFVNNLNQDQIRRIFAASQKLPEMLCTKNSLEMPGYGKRVADDNAYKAINSANPDEFLKFYRNFYSFVERNEDLIKSKGVDLRRDENRQMYIYDEKGPQRETFAKHHNTIIQEVNSYKTQELLGLLFVKQGKDGYNYLNERDFRVATKYMGAEDLRGLLGTIDSFYIARGAYHMGIQNGKEIMQPGMEKDPNAHPEQFSNNESVWKRKALYDLFQTLMMEKGQAKMQEYKEGRSLGDKLNPAKTKLMLDKIKADYAMPEIPEELRKTINESRMVMQRDLAEPNKERDESRDQL